MIRSLLSIVLTLACFVPAFAQDFTAEQEANLLRQAEDQVVAAVTIRGNQPRISGSAVIDRENVQVDLFYVNAEEMIVPNSAERFLFNVPSQKISSLGAPTSEVAILPVRDVMNKVKSDAIARFEKVHPGLGEGIPDGIAAQIKSTHTDGNGHVIVTCESFGGIAGMWMGDSITYTYSADGSYVTETR